MVAQVMGLLAEIARSESVSYPGIMLSPRFHAMNQVVNRVYCARASSAGRGRWTVNLGRIMIYDPFSSGEFLRLFAFKALRFAWSLVIDLAFEYHLHHTNIIREEWELNAIVQNEVPSRFHLTSSVAAFLKEMGWYGNKTLRWHKKKFSSGG